MNFMFLNFVKEISLLLFAASALSEVLLETSMNDVLR